MESLLTGLNVGEKKKNSQQPPQEAELVLYVMRKDVGMTKKQVCTASVSLVIWCTQRGLWNPVALYL